MADKLPRISIIIPSKNGRATIGKCLDSVVALEYPDVEVLVINDGSTDGTEAVLAGYAQRYPQVQLLQAGGAGPSAARNLGIARATGEYLAFTDDDCIVDRQWLAELLRGFDAPAAGGQTVGGVGGNQGNPEDDHEFGKTVGMFLKAAGMAGGYVKPGRDAGIIETRHNPTCNVLFRREVFARCGGFREGLWPGEDVEFDYRARKAGFRLRYNPAAMVYHYRPATVRRFARMMYSYGKAQALLVREYGFFRTLQYEPLALLVLAVVALGGVRGVQSWSLLVLSLAGVAFLGALARARDAALALRFLSLGLITLVCWNSGFVAGMVQHRHGCKA